MHYSKIKRYDISNGLGIRTTIYFCGCPFHCEGCFNPELWDKNAGKEFDEKTKEELFRLLSDEHCDGLSVLGGEPMVQGKELTELLKEVKITFPNKTIWLWSGYKLQDILNDPEKKSIANYCDYIVDGQFKEELSKVKLRFRGSSNQIIWKKGEDGGFYEDLTTEGNIRWK